MTNNSTEGYAGIGHFKEFSFIKWQHYQLQRVHRTVAPEKPKIQRRKGLGVGSSELKHGKK